MDNANFLIIEDHHLMIGSYKSMLELNQIKPRQIVCANTCEQVYLILQSTREQFDFVILDWSLPAYKKMNLETGSDLVRLINEHSPSRKLIVITSHTEAFTLYEIVRDAKPQALLCKTDFLIEDFLQLKNSLSRRELYYSKTVLEQLKLLKARGGYLDNYDRQIIILLSKGIKTKNLPNYLPLSISAIDKRKAYIRDYFLLEKGSDEDIIDIARKEGLI